MSTALVPMAAAGLPARVTETNTAAFAAQAKAAVEARYVIAMGARRDIMQFRSRLLADCARPSFAKQAEWAIRRGGKLITGESIRFVEAAMRHYTNILVETAAVFDDDERLIQRITVTDLETNTTLYQDVVVRKTVERRSPEGRTVISSRVNSEGQTVYTVLAGDDEILQKTNSLASKAIRTLVLRLLPADIVEEAIALCRLTVKQAEAAEDPSAAVKKIADAFERLGILPAQLAAFLGHSIEVVTSDELAMLRTAFVALKDGLSTWAEIMADVHPDADSAETPVQARKRGVSALKERLDAREAKKAAPGTESTTPAAESRPEGYQDDSDLAEA